MVGIRVKQMTQQQASNYLNEVAKNLDGRIFTLVDDETKVKKIEVFSQRSYFKWYSGDEVLVSIHTNDNISTLEEPISVLEYDILELLFDGLKYTEYKARNEYHQCIYLNSLAKLSGCTQIIGKEKALLNMLHRQGMQNIRIELEITESVSGNVWVIFAFRGNKVKNFECYNALTKTFSEIDLKVDILDKFKDKVKNFSIRILNLKKEVSTSKLAEMYVDNSILNNKQPI